MAATPKRIASYGDWVICWQGSLLVVEFFSPFTDSEIESFMDDMKEVVRARPHLSWQILEIFENDVLSRPEALEMVDGLFNFYHKHGCDNFAFVIKHSVHRLLVRKVVVGEYQVFEDKPSALNWLAQQYPTIEL